MYHNSGTKRMSEGAYLVATFSNREQLLPATQIISRSDAVWRWNAVEGHAHLVIKLKGNSTPEEIASLPGIAFVRRYEILSDGEPAGALIDPAQSCAYVFAEVEPSKRQEVADALNNMPDVLFCSQVGGGCDLVAAVKGPSFQAVDRAVEEGIRPLDGILRLKVERIIDLTRV
jgi:hypothetical protein